MQASLTMARQVLDQIAQISGTFPKIGIMANLLVVEICVLLCVHA